MQEYILQGGSLSANTYGYSRNGISISRYTKPRTSHGKSAGIAILDWS
jgi:hypothetical protein